MSSSRVMRCPSIITTCSTSSDSSALSSEALSSPLPELDSVSSSPVADSYPSFSSPFAAADSRLSPSDAAVPNTPFSAASCLLLHGEAGWLPAGLLAGLLAPLLPPLPLPPFFFLGELSPSALVPRCSERSIMCWATEKPSLLDPARSSAAALSCARCFSLSSSAFCSSRMTALSCSLSWWKSCATIPFLIARRRVQWLGQKRLSRGSMVRE
mmetsp:Transcript_35893/g.88392  ORF Transcript_35893/g.88392 Transcript_35893/m.88392 type:complete len:212 (-) Transcript_35893:1686-2321(-)